MIDYRQLVAQHHAFAFKVAEHLLKKPDYFDDGQEFVIQYDFDPNGRLLPSYPKEGTPNSFTVSLDANLIDSERARDIYALTDAIA